MKNQEIKFKRENYSIIIGKNIINILPKKIKILCPKTKKIALIVDKKIPQRFKRILSKKLIIGQFSRNILKIRKEILIYIC